MSILSAILNKKGISEYGQLQEHEKKTYAEWASVLNKPDVTIEDLRKLLPAELTRARKEQNQYDNTTSKDLFFKAYIRVLETLTTIIVTPAQEREALRAELTKRFEL